MSHPEKQTLKNIINRLSSKIATLITQDFIAKNISLLSVKQVQYIIHCKTPDIPLSPVLSRTILRHWIDVTHKQKEKAAVSEINTFPNIMYTVKNDPLPYIVLAFFFLSSLEALLYFSFITSFNNKYFSVTYMYDFAYM